MSLIRRITVALLSISIDRCRIDSLAMSTVPLKYLTVAATAKHTATVIFVHVSGKINAV